jgi:hypothetical protein
MDLTSTLLRTGHDSVVLNVAFSGIAVEVFVVVVAAIDAIPDTGHLRPDAETHVAVVDKPSQAPKEVPMVLKRTKTGDGVVFLCRTPKTYDAVCHALGYKNSRAVFDAKKV